MERFKCHFTAMQLLKNDNITLDVFSSTKIYGDQFMDSNDKDINLYMQQAKNLKM